MHIGYLVSVYPAPSHTFIRREIEALRNSGLRIDTFSIRRPPAGELKSAQDHTAHAETWYVLPVQPLALLVAHGATLATEPLTYLRVFGMALRHRPPGLGSLLLGIVHFAEAVVLARELKRRSISHLHNHFGNSGAAVGLLTSLLMGIPWSLTLHGISETDYPAGLLLGDKIKHAAFVACVSYFGRAQAMRTVAAAHWNKLFISRCGLQLADLPARPAARPGASPRVICVARLSPEKAHTGLLMAFAEVLKRGHKAELVLVGDGDERAHIEATIRDLGLGAAVALRGQLSEAETLAEVAASDVLVLASFMEGLPVVLMEAMALGVPAIASRVAGVPELIEDGHEGLLFNPTDWTDLAQKLETVLSDPALRARLGVAARAKIEAEFKIETAVQPMHDHLTGAFAPHVP